MFNSSHGKHLSGVNVCFFLLRRSYLPSSLLQVIKILGTEKGKKNKTNLIFVAGNRVLKYSEKSYNMEKSLTSLLK